MKLIDILNMISKGELKEGTKVIYKDTKFEYERLELEDDEGYSIMYCVNDILDLSDECELIEPDHFADGGKMAEKIEELDVKGLSDIFISNDAFNKMVAFSTTLHKLNEVINKVNAQTKVLLAQDKEIKEINEQLDY